MNVRRDIIPALLILIISGVVISQYVEEYCYDSDRDRLQTKHFATKTAYQIVRGLDSSRQYLVPNCYAVKFWFFGRHGTRLPTKSNIEEMQNLESIRDDIIDNYEKRRSRPDSGGLCDRDLNLLKEWRWDRNITVDYAQYLTEQGWNDLKYLAIHYKRIFPNVLQNIYTPERFLFRHTDAQRTEASYKAFVEGLFGDNASDHIQLPEIPAEDTLLRPYDYCPQYEENRKANEGPNSEQSKFEKTNVFQDMLRGVSSRLGFRYTLSADQVGVFWDMCRFDQAWKLDKVSAWCACFTPDHVSVLEYKEDLKYYYGLGYGSEVNSKLSCSAIQDMLKHLDSKESPEVVAYFTHNKAIELILTGLGAAKDRQALRADNYAEMKRRAWQTSQIGPFASNLAAIKYECSEDFEQNKIMFFLNEKPLEFNWCNVGLCDYSKVKEQYKEFIEADCSKSFCGFSNSNKIKISLASIISLQFILIISYFK